MKILFVVLFFIPFSLLGQECPTVNSCILPGTNICTGCCDGSTVGIIIWSSSNGTCSGAVIGNGTVNCSGPFTFSSDVTITSTPCTLSIEDIDALNNSSIIIYPNPSNGKITIRGDKEELREVKIYNGIGQDVSSFITITIEDETHVIIDLSALSSGIYAVKTKTTVHKVVYKQ